jgi:hypothetical protein
MRRDLPAFGRKLRLFEQSENPALAGKSRFFEQSENHLSHDRPAFVPQFSERNSGSSFVE